MTTLALSSNPVARGTNDVFIYGHGDDHDVYSADYDEDHDYDNANFQWLNK